MLKSRTDLLAVAVVLSMLFTLPTQAQTLLSIFNRATQARDRATEARNHSQVIRDEMQDAVQTLTGDMRSFINDFLAEASRIIAEEKEGRDEWVNGPDCGSFRQDLVSMLQHMQVIFNELSLIADPDATPISFDDEIQLINRIPCEVLYPLYRVMTASDAFGDHMLDLLGEGASALQTIGEVVSARYHGVPNDSLDYELGQAVNQLIIADPRPVDKARLAVQALGMVLKSAGQRLNSKAQKGVETVHIAIWGWVGLTLKSDQKSKWGTLLVSLSGLLEKASETAKLQINHAMLIGSLSEIRDNQLQILENQELMLDLLQNPNP